VFFVVTRQTWKWPMWKALPPLVLFLSFDLPFFAANLTKFFEGGWIPVLVGAVMFIVMIDWRVGRTVLAERLIQMSPPLAEFLAKAKESTFVRIPGTAIILSANPEGTPPVLTTQVRRIRALREHVVLLTVSTAHVPYVNAGDRVRTEDLGNGFYRVWIQAGFMEKPHVPELLASANLPVDLDDATYFLGRETFLAGKGGKMGVLSESLFAFLARNSTSPTHWFSIPPDQVVELGMQIDL
jgi:KUP system potassium uptake protein